MALRRRITNAVIVAAGMAVVVAACSGGATDGPAEGSGTTASPTTSAATDPTSTTTTQQASTTTTILEEELFLTGLDVPEIEQLTPRSGVGHRPLLEWVSVPGAGSYEVTFFDEDGFLYWAWTGNETSVYLGGVAAPDGTPGPAALEGMSWAVVALDDTGAVIAQSRVRSIAR